MPTAAIHARWLNQIGIYFSVLQRKVLTPNDFPSLPPSRKGFDFQRHYQSMALPFDWRFTRTISRPCYRKLERSLVAA